MSLSIFVLKTALLRYGVIIDQVRFEVDGECIVIEYKIHGRPETKTVPFAEIEDLLSESTGTGPGASSDDVKKPGGHLPGG